ncbi:MAG: hypothetical protein JHD16_15170 [Solirubrobacteraceae bacterium]|nr:hypothetical protein [Solirubrobacteraceae bacterium]
MFIRSVLTCAAATLACAAMPMVASAAAPIEGSWTYSGGQVAVKAGTDGTLTGIVIRETRLTECLHPVGEPMWTKMALQPDGQYFGSHQWYNETPCAPTPTLGNSAWRLLTRPDGQVFLRFCSASHLRPDRQPSIAQDGTPSNFGRPCFDSEPVPVGKKPTFANTVVLPAQGKRKCLPRRSFVLRMNEPAGDALASGTVAVNGKVVKRLTRAEITQPVNITRLPRGRYKVRVVTTTVLGKTIKGTRAYLTCSKRA